MASNPHQSPIHVVSANYSQATIFLVPESPRWLYAHGRFADADNVLARIYSTTEDSDIVLRTRAALVVETELEANERRGFNLVLDCAKAILHDTTDLKLGKRLRLVILITFLQEMSGLNVVSTAHVPLRLCDPRHTNHVPKDRGVFCTPLFREPRFRTFASCTRLRDHSNMLGGICAHEYDDDREVRTPAHSVGGYSAMQYWVGALCHFLCVSMTNNCLSQNARVHGVRQLRIRSRRMGWHGHAHRFLCGLWVWYAPHQLALPCRDHAGSSATHGRRRGCRHILALHVRDPVHRPYRHREDWLEDLCSLCHLQLLDFPIR